MSSTPQAATKRMTPAAERILSAASELFYANGIRAVGVEAIAQAAGVTKKTIYDRFGSKDALIEAYLNTRDLGWRQLVASRLEGDHSEPRQQILAMFDLLGEWMSKPSRRGCCFINAYGEIGEIDHPARQVAASHKVWLRQYFSTLASNAGAHNPELLASQLLMLHEGAIVAYSMTDNDNAASEAKDAAASLLAALDFS